MDFLMNAVFVACAIMLGSFVLFQLPEIIYFHLTTDKIENEKLTVEYLEKRYNEQYPSNKSIQVDRPRKKHQDWKVFIETPSNDKKGAVSANEYVKKHIIFFDGLYNKIQRESTYLSYKKDEDHHFVSVQNWDRDGNELDAD